MVYVVIESGHVFHVYRSDELAYAMRDALNAKSGKQTAHVYLAKVE